MPLYTITELKEKIKEQEEILIGLDAILVETSKNTPEGDKAEWDCEQAQNRLRYLKSKLSDQSRR